MFQLCADEAPRFSLFHGNPKFKCSRTTRIERPACGKCVGGPVIYSMDVDWRTFFSLYCPDASKERGRGNSIENDHHDEMT